MNTQIIYRNKEAEKKKDLIEEINGRMGIPSCGLIILFATEDSYNRPDWRANYDDRYTNQGFCTNVEI
jgi:hypothetical protein